MTDSKNLDEYADTLAKNARAASSEIRTLGADERNSVLKAVAKSLRAEKAEILAANAKDLARAKGTITDAMMDRLTLNDSRIETMARGAEEIADFADPLARMLESRTLKNGVRISRVAVPIGSVFFIYESRPNVTIDGASLCFKSGNAVILRGGKESIESGKFLAGIFRRALRDAGVTENAVQLVTETDHALVTKLLQKNDCLDLVIPRGGERLIRAVVEQSKIPVIKHFNGICHIYVDRSADFSKVPAILENAKTQRPSTCNAMETLLIDRSIDDETIAKFLAPLRAKGVEMFGDKEAQKRIPGVKDIGGDENYHHEYLALQMSVRFVADVQEACAHIEKYSSRHTDSILAEDSAAQDYFVRNVDSASVMVNVSTRLADGGIYGLGAEVGISTDKLHARGPMGIESLCTYKWVLKGEGQVRE